MAIQTLNTIKEWFRTSLKPTQTQFWDTWDSFRHKFEKIPVKDIEGIDELLLTKADKTVLDNHLADKSAHAPQVNTDWNSESGFSQLVNKPEFKTINGETIVGTGNIAIATETADLQSVLDTNPAAKYGNSSATIMGNYGDSKYNNLTVGNDTDRSSMLQLTNQVGFQYSKVGINTESNITVSESGVNIKRSLNGKTTDIVLEDPTVNTLLKIPAKSEEGNTYIIATTDDFKTINGESIVGEGDITIKGGGSQNIQQVLELGNVATFNHNGNYQHISVFGGVQDESFQILTSGIMQKRSIFTVEPNYVSLYNIDHVAFYESNVTISDGAFNINQRAGNNLTSLNFIEPKALTSLSFPAKPAKGDGEPYIIATTSDFKTINGESIVGEGNITVEVGATPEATSAVKGIVKLTGDLGGTADLPTTPTAIHITGNESFTGVKSSINTGVNPNGQNGGFELTNNSADYSVLKIINNKGKSVYISNEAEFCQGIRIKNAFADSEGVDIENIGTGTGLNIYNFESGKGIRVNNISTGTGIEVVTTNGYGIKVSTFGNHVGISSTNNSVGSGYDSDNNSTGVGIDLRNNSTGVGLSISNKKEGDGFLLINSASGKGFVLSNNSEGRGLDLTNGANGYGIFLENGNIGIGQQINNRTTGTGLGLYNIGSGRGLVVDNQKDGEGIYLYNSKIGTGLNISNLDNGKGAVIDNLGSGYGFQINNSSSGKGIYLQNELNGKGLELLNQGGGNGVVIKNLNTGFGQDITNSGAGYGSYISNTLNGTGSYISNTGTGIGMRLDNWNTNAGIAVINNAAGNGYDVNNKSTGIGVNVNNNSTGSGIEVFNMSTGNGIIANGSASSTGFNFIGKNNGANTFTVDKSGNIVSNGTISTTGVKASSYGTTDLNTIFFNTPDNSVINISINVGALTPNRPSDGICTVMIQKINSTAGSMTAIDIIANKLYVRSMTTTWSPWVEK